MFKVKGMKLRLSDVSVYRAWGSTKFSTNMVLQYLPNGVWTDFYALNLRKKKNAVVNRP